MAGVALVLTELSLMERDGTGADAEFYNSIESGGWGSRNWWGSYGTI